MKPPLFNYYAPTTVDQAVEYLGDETLGPRILAGGQSLVPMMNLRVATPGTLIDIRNIEGLAEISVRDDGGLVIGAGVTQNQALEHPEVTRGWPLLAEALTYIGNPQIRNRGTVCGSLAHNDPAAELPAIAVALGAELTAQSKSNIRVIPAEDFFISFYQTELAPDEMIVQVAFPPRPAGEGHALLEVNRKHGDFALVGVGAVVERSGDVINSARVVVFGADHKPRWFPAMEEELKGTTYDQPAVGEVVSGLGEMLSPTDDNRASGEYRRDVATELAKEAVHLAWQRTF